MLGRCVGLLFFLPLPLVLKSPNLRTSKRRIAAIAMLIVSQGLYGWYMVKSGLEVNDDQVPRVSHYRLATHFLLASLLFLLSLKESAIHLLSDKINKRQLLSLCPTQSVANASKRSLRFTQATFWTVFATSLLGCLVAGLDAGLVYNTWPKMDNKFLPWHLIGENGSFFSDPATVQILHRFVAYTAFINCHRLFFLNRKTFSKIPALRNFSLAILGLAYAQLLLGIASLHSNVKVWIASLHQVNSLNLLGTIFLSLFI